MTQLCNGASGWMNTMGGTSSPSSPSVRAPAGWTSHRHHRRLSLRQHYLPRNVIVVVVAICPCASWLAKSLSSPVLWLVVAIVIPICPCRHPSRHHRRLSCGSSSPSVALPFHRHRHRHRHLSLRQLPKSSPSSPPSVPWLIIAVIVVAICPWGWWR